MNVIDKVLVKYCKPVAMGLFISEQQFDKFVNNYLEHGEFSNVNEAIAGFTKYLKWQARYGSLKDREE